MFIKQAVRLGLGWAAVVLGQVVGNAVAQEPAQTVHTEVVFSEPGYNVDLTQPPPPAPPWAYTPLPERLARSYSPFDPNVPLEGEPGGVFDSSASTDGPGWPASVWDATNAAFSPDHQTPPQNPPRLWNFAYPPDPMGAMNRTGGYITAINHAIGYFPGGSSAAWAVSASEFLRLLNTDSRIPTDPMVRWDRFTRRWVVTWCSVGSSAFWVAVSQPDSSTAFRVWQLPALANVDYVSLSVDENAIWLAAPIASAVQQSKLFAIPKAGVDFNNAPTLPIFEAVIALQASTPSGSDGVQGPYRPRAADVNGPASPSAWFIGSDIDNANNRMWVVKAQLLGTPTPTALSFETYPLRKANGEALDAWNNPIEPRQPNAGGIANLDEVGRHPFHAQVVMNVAGPRRGLYSLWTAHLVGNNTNPPDRNGIRWYEIGNLENPGPNNGPVVLQQGLVLDTGSNPFSYLIPSLAATGTGNMFMAATTVRANLPPSIATLGRWFDATAGQTTTPSVLLTGTSASGTRRWGDYTITSLDPRDGQTFWSWQQWANGGPGQFGDWKVAVVRSSSPPPPPVGSYVPAEVARGSNNVLLRVVGSGVAQAAWFDGGPAYVRRLQAQVMNGTVVDTQVTVVPGSVQLVDHQTVELRINVPANPTGTQRWIRLTNPDLQASPSSAVRFNLVAAPPASFTQQPVYATGGSMLATCPGTNGTVICAAASTVSGTPTLTWQWRTVTAGATWQTIGAAGFVSGLGTVSFPSAGSTVCSVPANSVARPIRIDGLTGNGNALGVELRCQASISGGTTVTSSAVSLVVPLEPTVTITPPALTVCAGDQIVLTATVGNPSGCPVTYQWLRNGNPIVNQTTPTLSVSPTTAGGSETYTCQVAFANQQPLRTVSASTVVQVRGRPYFTATQAPPTAATCEAQPLTLTTQAQLDSAGSILYQWQREGPANVWTDIPGAVRRSATLFELRPRDSGRYRCRIRNSLCAVWVDSSVATFNVVVQGPNLSGITPVNLTACPGSTVLLQGTRDGSATPGTTYEWLRQKESGDFGPLQPRVFTPTLNLVGVQIADSGRYRLQAVAQNCTVLSPIATITVAELSPAISSQAILTNATTRLDVQASASGGTFAWFKNNVVIPGETRSFYKFIIGKCEPLTTYRANWSVGNCSAVYAIIHVCTADFDADAMISNADFDLFMGLYAREPLTPGPGGYAVAGVGGPAGLQCDITGDGFVNADDFLLFLRAFLDGDCSPP